MSRCGRCEREATVRLTDVDVNGCMREAFLCDECAKTCGILTPNAYDLIDGLPSRECALLLSNRICPNCGCTHEWLEAHKRIGCPQCYRAFDDVKPCGFKDCNVYFGKIPAKQRTKEAFQPRLQYLEEKMKTMAKNECFEAAQAVRRQIRSIEREMKRCIS